MTHRLSLTGCAVVVAWLCAGAVGAARAAEPVRSGHSHQPRVLLGAHDESPTAEQAVAGPSTLAVRENLSLLPDWFAESNRTKSFFGSSVATAGDVNGDGFSDVIVGAPRYDAGRVDEGRVFVYHGSPQGLSTVPAWTATSNLVGAQLGFSAATAGDVNGDGYDDIIVGAAQYSNGEAFEGAAFVYLGSAAGLSAFADWSVEGDQMGAGLGAAVATAGDVDGDGNDDVIIGAPGLDGGSGRAFVYRGSSSGLETAASWTTVGEAFAQLGASVATAGDLNADGFQDVIVGSPGANNSAGRADVFLGSRTGLLRTRWWTAAGSQPGEGFGVSVAGIGSINGTPYGDIVVGAPDYDGDHSSEGRAYVFSGSNSGLGDTPVWIFSGGALGAEFGVSASPAGDVNGDGFADLVVGAASEGIDPAATFGRVRLFLGSPTGLGAVGAATIDGQQEDALFGLQVTTAGDVNGDGFSDLIVGSNLYTNGQSQEGRAFVYHGAPSRPNPTPIAAPGADQTNALLGTAVAGAGDINGDGFADVIGGASAYDDAANNEGRVFVYVGTADGLDATPIWEFGSGNSGADLGISVAGAGDVNGDGYDDIVAGARDFVGDQDQEGRAYVFFGSPSGLADEPDWVADGNQALGEFGQAVAGAGDVNGDGFADIIVGAWKASVDVNREGRAFVFLGSPAGPSTTPDWSAASGNDGAEFGAAVASAGDVNGDGFCRHPRRSPDLRQRAERRGRRLPLHGLRDRPESRADLGRRIEHLRDRTRLVARIRRRSQRRRVQRRRRRSLGVRLRQLQR